MMKITGLSHLFKWENLHNWWLTKYFFCPTVYGRLIHIFCTGFPKNTSEEEKETTETV